MSGKHEILIIEDDPKTAGVMRDTVCAMDFDCRIATTLQEARACFDERLPCAVLQDMQLPHAPGAEPHERGGETCMRWLRELSNGPMRVPVVVVTAMEPGYELVWAISKMGVEHFVIKADVRLMPGKLMKALEETGRKEHGSCAGCNAASAVKGVETRATDGVAEAAAGVKVATLYGHDRWGVAIDAQELRGLVARRAEFDLFLDTVTVDPRGKLAGKRDYEGNFHEDWLTETRAQLLLELLTARKEVRADSVKALRGSSQANAVRLVQKARGVVDVRLRVKGKESRTEWRSLHTRGEKGALGFVFEPAAGVTFVIVGRRGRE